jgi:hypothetical protein
VVGERLEGIRIVLLRSSSVTGPKPAEQREDFNPDASCTIGSGDNYGPGCIVLRVLGAYLLNERT